MRIFSYIVILSLVAFQPGCSKQAQLVLLNRSGVEIIFTDVEGKPLRVLPDERVQTVFPGINSPFSLMTDRTKFSYTAAQYPPREYRGEKYPYAVNVVLKPDMSFYVCYPDGSEVLQQPEGFPLIPMQD